MQMGNADLTQHLLHNNAYAPKVPQLQHRGGSDHNPGSSFDAASGSDSRQVPKPIPVPDTGRQDPPPPKANTAQPAAARGDIQVLPGGVSWQ